MRKVLKGLYTIVGLYLILLLLSKCGNSSSSNSSAERIYVTKCVRCHGKDGKRGKKGAKDLTISTMPLESRIKQLKQGKDKMPSFSDRLTEEQIKQVAMYTIETFGLDSLSQEVN